NVTATNGAGTDTKELFIVVTDGSHTVAPTITSTVLPAGEVGTAYSTTLTATGDTPMGWGIIDGALPTGLALNPATGVISGTPSVDGVFVFNVTAINGAGNDTKELSIVIDSGSASVPPTITTTTLPSGQSGTAYSTTLAATGDTPIGWAIRDGALPTGLALNPATGVISGTPTTNGLFTFNVTATNGAGTDTKEFTITITSRGGGTGTGNATIVPSSNGTMPEPQPEPIDEGNGGGIIDEGEGERIIEPEPPKTNRTYLWIILLILLGIALFILWRKYGNQGFNKK
ncbi:MAG: Ig domain-containing protein, partial [Methanimicrococcus sp.]|nr:Ig domain-containing protein [Methanimicrococcus sp.]